MEEGRLKSLLALALPQSISPLLVQVLNMLLLLSPFLQQHHPHSHHQQHHPPRGTGRTGTAQELTAAAM